MIRKLLIALLLCQFCASAGMAEYYAVLITGDTPDTGDQLDAFWYDVYLTWEMLYTYGWKDENVHVLFGFGEDWVDQMTQNPRYISSENYDIQSIVDDSAYYNDVEDVFNDLSAQMTEDDFLFVWTFGHGKRESGYNWLELMDDSQMCDTTFANLLDLCEYDVRAISMHQCYSGGFIPDLENETTFIMTASSTMSPSTHCDDELPDADDQLENEYFSAGNYYCHHQEQFYHFVNALRLQTIVGNTFPNHPDSTPDVNQDGLTSITEAWDWVDSTSSTGNPQVSDLGSIGDGIFLNIPPYTPTGFYGTIVNQLAVLNWNKNTEYDLDHYEIHRKTYDHTTQLYSFWAFLATTTDTTYTDSTFAPHNGSDLDTAWYKIAAVDEADLVSEFSELIRSSGEIRPASRGWTGFFPWQSDIIFGDNYPNPFNPTTAIDYTLPEAAFVELKVYDVCGREVATLINKWLPSGNHQITFDGYNQASGIYLYRLKVDNHVITKKMVMLK